MYATAQFLSLLVPLALSLWLVINSNASNAESLSRISARGQWLVDEYGRVRLFHGANSVIKHFPWYDPQALNETRLKYYKSWGFNVIRLGTMWTGLEPTENKYNQTYIDMLTKIVNRFSEYGIYALLDVHQDGLTHLFNSYDGVPPWLFQKLPKPKQPYPWPFEGNATKSWWQVYLTEACGFAFQSIYDNKGGSLDCFSAMWKKVASVFKDSSSVIGYELINEPWAGDVYGDPLIIFPGMAGKYNLKPMYDHINTAIREVDNKTLIFFEPTTIAVVFNGSTLGTGFDTPPGGVNFRNRSVLAWHYYCWLITAVPIDPYSGWKRDACDDILGPKVFKSLDEDSSHLKVPTFLSEFGICIPNNSSTSKGTIECEFVMRKADQHLVSWTYWDSEFFNYYGNLNIETIKAFARVYARAIAGIPTQMSFSATSREFLLQFTLDPTIKQPTEVFVPLLHYKNGFIVNVSADLKWSWDEDTSCVLVVSSSSYHSNEKQTISTVTLTPK